MSDRHPKDRLKRELSLTDAVMLVVASVVGAGIFFTPSQVATLLPAPEWIMAAWVAGALLSYAGALANAELAAMYPHAGGNYVYLREAFHPAAGFLVGWLTFFAIYAGTIAALAIAFGHGTVAFFDWPEQAALPIAIGTTAGVSVLNYLGVRRGAQATTWTSMLKLAALVAFAVLGPIFGDGDWSRLLPRAAEGGAATPTLAAFGQAMSPVLFTYLGWNACVYVASEVRDPDRNLPRSLFLGLLACAVIYLMVNAVYLYALPLDQLQGAGDAGEAAARALFGPVGGSLVAVFVLLSVLGTLNATALVGPRIPYAMALDGLFLRQADQVSAAFRTPSIAIAVQGGIAILLLLLLRSFPSALDYTTFAILIATMADVLALYRLRAIQPGRSRPYRAWGYPWIPALYLVANAGIALALLIGSPRECAIGLAMLASGLPFYLFFARARRGATEPLP